MYKITPSDGEMVSGDFPWSRVGLWERGGTRMDLEGSLSVGESQWGSLEEAGPWFVPFRQRAGGLEQG